MQGIIPAFERRKIVEKKISRHKSRQVNVIVLSRKLVSDIES